MGDGGMGVVALIRKNTGVLGGAGHYNLCWSIKLCWSDYK